MAVIENYKTNLYYHTLILGAGISGLACGCAYLRNNNTDFLILEKSEKPGGLCKSFKVDGFYFDYTGHLLHSLNPQIQEFICNYLNINLNKFERIAEIYFRKQFIKYPFQFNISALPKKLFEQCLNDYINAINSKNLEIKSTEYDNYKNWLLAEFGRQICNLFMFPYNKKLWRRDLEEITTDWIKSYIPRLKAADLKKIVKIKVT